VKKGEFKEILEILDLKEEQGDTGAQGDTGMKVILDLKVKKEI